MEKLLYRSNLELIRRMYPDRITLTVDETATLLGLDRKTVYKMVHEGRLANQNIGQKKILIGIPALARWMA
jgi:excisionase family DNA binding protein